MFMNKENTDKDTEQLFDIISQEDIVLFVGAGVSCSVGLPSGGELAKEIVQLLPAELQKDLQKTGGDNDLAKASSAYVNHFGKDSKKNLINHIKQIFEHRYPQDFSRTPLNVLSRISHFKTIISTNYDDIIEKCISDHCVVIANDGDVSKVTNHNVTLVKIHGDFDNQDEIVLTTEDYSELYNNKMDTPRWSLVKSKLATCNVLFLGYGYNDSNIDSLFLHIDKYVKNRKKVFLITQNIPPIKRNELTAKNIIPIEMDLNIFFQKLIIRFNATIISDFQLGKTSHETLLRYTAPYLTPVIEGSKFKYAKPNTPDIPTSFTFSTDKKHYRKMTDPNNFDAIQINDIQGFKLKMGDITIPYGEIAQIQILRNPEEEFSAAIYFIDADIEIDNIQTKIYRGKNKVKATCELAGGIITLLIQFNKKSGHINLHYEANTEVKSIKDEIIWLELIVNLLSGELFRLTTSTGLNITRQVPKDANEMNSQKNRLAYLKQLREIEKNYGITFIYPIRPTKHDIHKANILCKNLSGNLIEENQDVAIKAVLTSKEDGNSLMQHGDSKFMFVEKEYTTFELHGQKIDLGYLMFEVIDPEYFTGENTQGEKTEISLRAPKGKYKAVYQSNPPESFLE